MAEPYSDEEIVSGRWLEVRDWQTDGRISATFARLQAERDEARETAVRVGKLRDAEAREAKLTLDWISEYHRGDSEECCEAAGGECSLCSVLDCPGNEPLHYHHDGCPHCDMPEETADATRD